MKYVILTATAAAVAATPAFAQDANVDTGFGSAHISATVGIDHTSADVQYEDTAFPADNFRESESTTGLVYGINAGYDFQLSPGSTLGIEGSYEWSDNERCEELFGNDEACFALKRNWYVGVRGGAQMGESTLLFAGLGYTNGRARISYTDPAFPADNFSVADDRDGWRASLGLEQSLGTNLFGKIEYRYSNYKNLEYADGTESIALGFQRHQVVAGLGMRF